MLLPTDAGSSPVQTLTEEEAGLIARQILAGRVAVASAYDRLAGRGQERRAPDFKTIALGQVGADAYRLALQAAANAGFLAPFLATLSEQGHIDLEQALRTAKVIHPQDASGVAIHPQGMTAEMMQLIQAARLLEGLSTAVRRVCLVEVASDPPVSGTGFLIGPQTVLTNWHVMHSLIDAATGQQKQDSASKIICRFEKLAEGAGKPYRAAEQWLVDFSPMAVNGIEGKAYPDMTARRPHALDFCAIRLTGAPGRVRGYYDLSKPGKLDSLRQLTFVVQHPSAWPTQVGVADGTVIDQTSGFIHHHAPTAEGSSGGLCLDHNLNPIGLHRAAATTAENVFLYNLAVDLNAIHKTCPELGKADDVYDRTFLLYDREGNQRAVIGRQRTQEHLRAMASGDDKSILFLHGEKRGGKSFTIDLLRALIGSGDRHVVVQLTPELIPSDPVKLARDILQHAGVPDGAVDLPEPDVTHGTTTAWMKSTLIPAFTRVLSEYLLADPAAPRTLWLVFDGLDQQDIVRTNARLFLDELYDATRLLKNLRVLLIGLRGLSWMNQSTHRIETLGRPDDIADEDVAEAISALLVDCGLNVHGSEVMRHAHLAIASAANSSNGCDDETRLCRLSNLLSSIWIRTAEKWRAP